MGLGCGGSVFRDQPHRRWSHILFRRRLRRTIGLLQRESRIHGVDRRTVYGRPVDFGAAGIFTDRSLRMPKCHHRRIHFGCRGIYIEFNIKYDHCSLYPLEILHFDHLSKLESLTSVPLMNHKFS